MAEAARGEIWLTSGRINERWQSGYDDRRRPFIVQLWPENWVELHPDDAAAFGVESGDYCMLHSDRIPVQTETIVGVEGDDFDFSALLKNGHIELTRAAVTAVVMVTPAVKKGVGYMDFLHTSQPANALAGRVVDWISGNYNYKMGIGKVQRLGESPYKHHNGRGICGVSMMGVDEVDTAVIDDPKVVIGMHLREGDEVVRYAAARALGALGGS